MTKHLSATLTIRARGAEPEITITTPTTDYMGDVIDPMGVDVSRYLAGPRAVFLAHDYGKLPVAQTLALTKSAQGIRARFRWLEGNPEAATVRRVFDEGALGASVGFVPIESEAATRGYRYTKSVLTEWSLTGNPANPECVKLFKSLGLGGAAFRSPRESSVDLDVTREDVRAAFRSPEIRRWIAEEAARRVRWSMLPPDADVLTLDDEEPDVLAGLTEADILTALRAGIGAAAEAGVRQAVNAARGRID